MFGGCFAAALWANNVKLRMPRNRITLCKGHWRIAGFGASVWAVTGGVLYRHSSVLAACLVLCHRHCHWFMVWRALYPAAHLPYSRENAESFCRLTADAKTGSGTASFSSRDGGLFRHAGLGAAHGDERLNWGWQCCLASALVY